LAENTGNTRHLSYHSMDQVIYRKIALLGRFWIFINGYEFEFFQSVYIIINFRTCKISWNIHKLFGHHINNNKKSYWNHLGGDPVVRA
jgi:hypothetical protein